jgi:hypothetical protein
MTERLKDKSLKTEGSEISNRPFFSFSEIIAMYFYLNLEKKD